MSLFRAYYKSDDKQSATVETHMMCWSFRTFGFFALPAEQINLFGWSTVILLCSCVKLIFFSGLSTHCWLLLVMWLLLNKQTPHSKCGDHKMNFMPQFKRSETNEITTKESLLFVIQILLRMKANKNCCLNKRKAQFCRLNVTLASKMNVVKIKWFIYVEEFAVENETEICVRCTGMPSKSFLYWNYVELFNAETKFRLWLPYSNFSETKHSERKYVVGWGEANSENHQYFSNWTLLINPYFSFCVIFRMLGNSEQSTLGTFLFKADIETKVRSKLLDFFSFVSLRKAWKATNWLCDQGQWSSFFLHIFHILFDRNVFLSRWMIFFKQIFGLQHFPDTDGIIFENSLVYFCVAFFLLKMRTRWLIRVLEIFR